MDLDSENKELPAARKRRLLRQLSKVARASLGTGLMGTLFPFPTVLVADLERNGTSLYGTPLSMHGLQDLVGSLLMLSSLPGAWITAALGMRLGRRKAMMVNGVVAFVGWLGVALIPFPAGILASRCVSGIAMGGLSVVVNAYVTELSDPDVRGMMNMCLNLAILLGQVLTVAVGYGARYFVVAFVNALVPAAFVAFLVWLPESPSVLVLKGKSDKATQVLLDLRGSKADVAGEVRSYKAFNEEQEGQGSTWRRLLQPSVAKDLLVVSLLFVIVYFTGFLVVNANAAQMFEAAGTTVDGGLAAIVLMLVQFGGGIAGFFLMDKIGRKNILYLGFFLMAAALGVMAAYCGVRQTNSVVKTELYEAESLTTLQQQLQQQQQQLQDHSPRTTLTTTTTTTTPLTTPLQRVETLLEGQVEGEAASWGGGGWVPLACLVVSQTAVSLGVNVMPFILNQEYFPTAIRSQASGVCFTVYTLATFAVLQLYTPMVTTFTQAGLYGFYGGVSLLGLLFTACCIRETMGEAVG